MINPKFIQELDENFIRKCPTDNWSNFFIYLVKKYKIPFIFITITSFAGLVEFFLFNSLTENFVTWFGQSANPATFNSLYKNLFVI